MGEDEQIKVLINEFKNGKKDSFVELIELVKDPAYRMIYAIVKSR